MPRALDRRELELLPSGHAIRLESSDIDGVFSFNAPEVLLYMYNASSSLPTSASMTVVALRIRLRRSLNRCSCSSLLLEESSSTLRRSTLSSRIVLRRLPARVGSPWLVDKTEAIVYNYDVQVVGAKAGEEVENENVDGACNDRTTGGCECRQNSLPCAARRRRCGLLVLSEAADAPYEC